MQRFSASCQPSSRSKIWRSTLWRGVVGCIVAYALILNALLASVLGAELALLAAAGLTEHCLADARAAGLDPAPAGQPDDSTHCAFCTLAAGPVLLPVAPSAAIIGPPQVKAPSAGNIDPIDWTGHPGKLPRGPPQRVAEA
jgi:hypothetical protein